MTGHAAPLAGPRAAPLAGPRAAPLAGPRAAPLTGFSIAEISARPALLRRPLHPPGKHRLNARPLVRPAHHGPPGRRVRRYLGAVDRVMTAETLPGQAYEWVTAPPAGLSAGRTHRPGPATDRALWARLIRQAGCADSRLDADQWFPVSSEAESARREAADAIAVCRACPVRSLCLAQSLLHWDIGQYGIWGGLVAADRARLRRELQKDASCRKEARDGRGV